MYSRVFLIYGNSIEPIDIKNNFLKVFHWLKTCRARRNPLQNKKKIFLFEGSFRAVATVINCGTDNINIQTNFKFLRHLLTTEY